MSALPAVDARDLDPMLRDVLEFERSWRCLGGAKGRRIRERFGISQTRYHQLLVRAIERPEALTYDPVLVLRLRRVREARRRRRLGARLGHPSGHG